MNIAFFIDLVSAYNWLTAHAVEIFAVLFGIHAAASIVANWTPTQADDKWVERYGRFIHSLAGNRFLLKKSDDTKKQGDSNGV